MDDLSRSVDNSEQVDAILLDFSKAFDKVPHRHLLYKLDEKSAQRDANTARVLAVVRFGHHPPARYKHANTQTGPITIYCTTAS